MKTCTKCNIEYDNSKKFCKSCGNQLTKLSESGTGTIQDNDKVKTTEVILLILIAYIVIKTFIGTIIFNFIFQSFFGELPDYWEKYQLTRNIVILSLSAIGHILFAIAIFYIRKIKIRIVLSILLLIEIILAYFVHLQSFLHHLEMINQLSVSSF